MSYIAPTPLRIVENESGVNILCARGKVCEMTAGYGQTQVQDAQFIVRACNAHDELVDVLETCLAYVDCGSPRSESDMVEQSIRKALAKTKEVPQ